MSSEFESEFKCEFLEEAQANRDITSAESGVLLKKASSDKFDKEDTIPLMVHILYSMPSFGKMSCLVLLSIHAIIYYESIGASLLYISFFVTLARAFEMLLKPTIAYLSDELRSSMGRRKPFMLFGCGFYAVFLVLLFSPPSLKTGTKTLSVWFGVFYVLFFMAETISNVPYLALGPELSTNSAEREKLYVFFYIFQYIGVLFASAAPIVLNRIFYECDCSICYNNPLILDIAKCVNKCEIICNLKFNQQSLYYLAIFIGSFFVISIILLSLKVREKHKSFNNEPMRLIPSLYQLINNKPFLSLIIPWVLDVTIMTIFSTMLPFFLNFIINPQKYCIDHKIDLRLLTCSVNYWLGTTISLFFMCCILFCYLWHLLVEKFGKKKCWQYLSLLCIVPFGLFFFCEEGSRLIVVVSSVLIAFPSGGGYLNDVLVSDTIDYNEFYTGKRNEGIFTVCSAFIPKFVSLFAQAIPLSFMSVIGFIPSNRGRVFDQPIQVKWFIRLFFSFVPILISLASFYFKLKYPIEDDKTMLKIKKAIILQKENIVHLQSKCDCYTIQDPVYNHLHLNIIFRMKHDNQRETKMLTDHFDSIDSLRLLLSGKYEQMSNVLLFGIIMGFSSLVFGVIILAYTFDYLSVPSYSFIPITFLFVISFSVIVIIICFLKYSVLIKVMSKELIINQQMLKLIVFQKESNEKRKKEKMELIEKDKIAPDCAGYKDN